MERLVSDLSELSTRLNFEPFLQRAAVLRGWAFTAPGNTAEGISWIEDGIGDYRATASILDMPFLLALKAEALHLADRTVESLEAIREADALVERFENRYWSAELHRLRGGCLAAMGADEAQIEASYCTAVRIAREQKSVSLQRRAESSYGEYRRRKGERLGHGLPPEQISVARLPITGSAVFGREEDLAFLNDAWANPHVNVVTIAAWAGVGKSTLVNHWLGQMAAEDYRSAQLVFGWSFYRQGSSGRLRQQMNFLTRLSIGLEIQTHGSERRGRRERDSRNLWCIAEPCWFWMDWSRFKIRLVHKKDGCGSLPSRHSCASLLPSILGFA